MNLEASSQSQNQMKSWFFLDVVIWQGSAIFKLLSSEDQSLLIWWDSFFVLDFGLDILDSVRCLNLESDGFASEGLDEDLHTSSETED